jgi:ketosteroid isomerase-like protein
MSLPSIKSSCAALVLLSACIDAPVTSPAGRDVFLAAGSGEGVEASAAAHLDLRERRDELLAADRAFAAASAASNVVDALPAMLTPDALFVFGPQYLVGAAAVHDALAANPANLATVQRWDPVRADVSSDGTVGYTSGYIELLLPSGAVVPGKYLAFWRRDAAGVWKVAAYKRGGRPAGPVSLVPPAGFETPDSRHERYVPNTDPASTRAAVMAVDQSFSDLASAIGTGEAFARFVAPDGAGFGGFAPFSYGAAELAASYGPYVAGALVWSPEAGEAAASGDFAFTSGGFQVRDPGPGGTWTVIGAGKYLTIWRRQPNGPWRFVMDG